MDQVQQQIVEGVEDNGWFAVTYVAEPGEPDERFIYTVGLTRTAGWPEIICFGLDPERMFGMLRDAIAECWDRKEAPRDGMQLDAVLSGLPARLRRFHAAGEPYFAMSRWYAQHSGVAEAPERLQLMWPDAAGRFPDQPGCDPKVFDLQTPKVTR